MSGRAKIGFGEALSDLTGFAPKARPRPPTSTAEAAAAVGFISRDPAPAPVPAAQPARQQRRYRTGRSAQINIKATPETIAAFYAWADSQGLSVAEAFERAVEQLSDS